MATVRRVVTLATAPEKTWDAVRDFGAVDRRLTPGVVTTSALDGDERVVRFASGVVVREVLVNADDEERRLVYGMVTSPTPFRHYNAAIEVQEGESGGSTLIWTVDLLPDEHAHRVEHVMDLGVAAMRDALK